MIFQKSSQNKKKDKIAFETAHNQVRDVIYMILKVEGYILSDFRV